MKKAWRKLGITAFWLSWPAIFAYLYFSSRTRVVVSYKDDVLVVKTWLGDGRWTLPGGGIHLGEKPEVCAVRELYEETGVRIEPNKLKLIYSGRPAKKRGLNYKMYVYGIRLEGQPAPVRQRFELTQSQWINRQDLIDSNRVSASLKHYLQVWFKV